MANNCLVTKLKSVVDNNTLVKIGEFKLEVDASSSAQLIVGGGSDYSHPHLTSKSLYNGNTYITIDGDGMLSIEDKYSITNMNFSSNSLSVNLDSMYGYDNMTSLNSICTRNDITGEVYLVVSGDISKLGSFTNLESLIIGLNSNASGSLDSCRFENLKVLSIRGKWGGTTAFLKHSPLLTSVHFDDKSTGININDFNGCTNLTSIVIEWSGNATGNVNTLAAAQAVSRNSGTLAIKIIGVTTQIVCNGSVLPIGTKTIKFGTSMENPTAEETAQGYQIV